MVLQSSVRNTFCFLALVISMLVLLFQNHLGVAASPNLLANPGLLGDEGTIPEGWRRTNVYSVLDETLFFLPNPENANTRILKIVNKDEYSYGLVSIPQPAEVGTEYSIRAMARSEGARAYVFLDFLDAAGRRITAPQKSSLNSEWHQIQATGVAPEGTVTMRVILYTDTVSNGTVYFRDVILEKVQPLEEEKSALQLEYEKRFPPILPGETPHWLAEPVAMEALDPNTVLAPWSPVEVENQSISVWGRRYDIGAWGLPCQIMTDGHEILAGPVRFEIKLTGESSMLLPSEFSILDQHDGRVRFTSSIDTNLVHGHVTSAYEYDGFSRFDVSLMGRESLSIERMELVIPIKSEHAKFIHHAAAWRLGQSQRRLAHAGALPDGDGELYVSGFKPMVWIGDYDRGIMWFSESDEYWWPFKSERSIRVTRENGRTELRISMIAAPDSPIGQEMNLSFGLMATPVKPLPEGWRNWRFVGYNSADFSPELDRRIQRHAIHWFTNWHIVSHYPVPRDMEAFKAQMDQERRRGTKRSYPYLDVTLLSRGDEVLIPGEDFVFVPPEYTAFGTQWEVKPPSSSTRLARVTPASEWADFVLASVKSWIVDGGASGIYLDESFPYADTDPAHGMGYTDHTGTRQPTYALYATRNFYKRLAYLFQTYADGPPALLVHTSSTIAVPYLSFADVMLDGEQHEFRMNDWSDPTRDPSYMELVPLEEWQAELMGKQYGLVPVLLPQFKEEITGRYPGLRSRRPPTREMVALALLHDMHIWPIWSHPATIVLAYTHLSQFNTGAPDVTFHPYWENQASGWVKTDGILVSYYERPTELLAIVVNTTSEVQHVELDWSQIGQEVASTARDSESRQQIEIINGKMSLTVQARDFRLIRINR